MSSAWADLCAAVAEAHALGAAFRISGGVVAIDGELPAALRDRLHQNQPLLFEYLGGGEPEREAKRFQQKLGVTIAHVSTRQAASEALAILEIDMVTYGGTLGLDIETAARPGQGEPRPAVHLNKDGGLSAVQPAIQDRTALDPHRAEIRTLQLYGGGVACFVFTGEGLAYLLSFPWLQRQHLVIHNAVFEIGFLHQHRALAARPAPDLRVGPGQPAPDKIGRVECTLQATGLIIGVGYDGSGRKLVAAAEYFLGLTPPKSLQTSDWGADTLSAGQLAYASSDAVLAYRLWPILAADLHRTERWAAYELQRRAAPAVAAMQLRGLLLDRDIHARQVDAWKTELAEARQRYQNDTGQAAPSTPQQVAEWLAGTLTPDQLARWPRTEKGDHLSTERKQLKRLIGQPGTAAVLRILALQKLLSSFGPGLADKISPVTGRLHPGFIIAASKAGRFTSSHPNMQQLPSTRAPQFRQAIVAAPGYLLIGCDWSQVELRAAAWISGDPELTRIYAEGLDLHRETAATMTGLSPAAITPEQRHAAKPVNFGAVYGIGAATLAQNAFADFDIEMSVADAQAALDQFFRRFAQLDRWRRDNYARCKAERMVRIGCGRVVEEAWEQYPLSFPQCCNLPIQGICADAMLRAIIIAHARLQQAQLHGGLVATVHDELLIEVIESEAETARDILQQAMIDAFQVTFPGAPTTGVAQATIGRSWAELKG